MTHPSLQSAIDRFCAWHRLTRCWTLAQSLVFSLTSLMALALLLDKLFFLRLPGPRLALALAALGLLILLGAILFLPRRLRQVCYLVDRQAGLKNLVSTALDTPDAGDDLSRLILHRADEALRRQKPRRLLRFDLRWTGRYSLVSILALAVLLLVPQADLLGRKKAAEKAATEKAAVDKGSARLAARLTAIESAPKPVGSIEGQKINRDFNLLAEGLKDLQPKDALLQLSQFENKHRKEFAAQRNFEQTARSLPQKLDTRDLTPDLQKKLQDLLKNLKEADFRQSATALQDMAKSLQDPALSAEARQALARELSKMMDSSKGKGLNPDLAKLLSEIAASPADMDKLLQQCQKAGQQMNEMADFCSECDSLKTMADGLKDARKAMVGDQFSDFNAKETEAMMEAESQACKLGLGEGNGNGDGEGMGVGLGEGQGQGGTGGEGQGRGGQPLENRTDTAFKKELSPSQIGQGRILHQLFVSGVPEKGEALSEYDAVLKSARQHAASSLARDKVPRESEQMVKTYFDSLELQKKGEAHAP